MVAILAPEDVCTHCFMTVDMHENPHGLKYRYGTLSKSCEQAFRANRREQYKSLAMMFAAFVIALVLVIGVPAMTHAQAMCGERGAILKQLGGEYEESLQAIGTTEGGTLVEVFASSTGTWTILESHPNGMSCVVGYGENYQKIPQKAAGRVS